MYGVHWGMFDPKFKKPLISRAQIYYVKCQWFSLQAFDFFKTRLDPASKFRVQTNLMPAQLTI